MLETAARNKEEALRDDDNVFDVAFEQQGGGAEGSNILSATDIIVCHNASCILSSCPKPSLLNTTAALICIFTFVFNAPSSCWSFYHSIHLNEGAYA